MVSEVEADLSVGNMSSESAIDSSLLGQKQDDEVMIQTPDGNLTVRIIDVF